MNLNRIGSGGLLCCIWGGVAIWVYHIIFWAWSLGFGGSYERRLWVLYIFNECAVFVLPHGYTKFHQ